MRKLDFFLGIMAGVMIYATTFFVHILLFVDVYFPKSYGDVIVIMAFALLTLQGIAIILALVICKKPSVPVVLIRLGIGIVSFIVTLKIFAYTNVLAMLEQWLKPMNTGVRLLAGMLTTVFIFIILATMIIAICVKMIVAGAKRRHKK